MEHVIQAKEYLVRQKFKSYLVIWTLIGMVIGSFILMLYIPLLFFLNPIAILVLLIYIYIMKKKFQFIRIVERILNFEGAEERLTELYVNLGANMEEIKDSINDPRKLWAGEITYNRANSNKFLLANTDYKIIKRVYEIYHKK